MLQKYFKYIICISILIAGEAFGQTTTQKWTLIIGAKQTSTFTDSQSCFTRCKNEIYNAIAQGFLTAGIDSFVSAGGVIKVYISLGQKFQLAKLNPGNAEEEVLSRIGYRERFFSEKPFNPEEIRRLIDKMLKYYENNGYPFATVSLDNVKIYHDSISANLKVNKRELIRVDSMEIVGTSSLKRSYLYNYTGIKSGSIYNENLIKQIDRRINQLPFARTTKPVQIYFTGSKARIIAFIDQKKASQLDGIVGFAPRSNINNKLVLTGELNLNLQNLFGTGKTFELHYRSFLINSQDLKVRMVYPYLFNSPIGVDYYFGMLKFDSLYLQVENDAGFQYALGGSNYLKTFYNVQNTSLLSVDTNSVKNNRQLPQFADMHTYLYGLSLKLNFLNYPANPTKGILIEASFGAGIKKIKKNNTIKEIVFTDSQSKKYTLYDSLELRSTQLKASLNLDKFWQLNKANVLRTQVISATLSAKEIFTNELFRIGGIKTLKGFDEQSIFATSYAILTIEYRYILGTNSNFILFTNGAWYERNTRQIKLSDTPFGFGAGVNFETGAGIFSLYYALGHQFNNPIEIKQGKVHFGLVNYF